MDAEAVRVVMEYPHVISQTAMSLRHLRESIERALELAAEIKDHGAPPEATA